jgi:hypothetical protein
VALIAVRAQDRFDVAPEVNAARLRGRQMNDIAVKQRGE